MPVSQTWQMQISQQSLRNDRCSGNLWILQIKRRVPPAGNQHDNRPLPSNGNDHITIDKQRPSVAKSRIVLPFFSNKNEQLLGADAIQTQKSTFVRPNEAAHYEIGPFPYAANISFRAWISSEITSSVGSCSRHCGRQRLIKLARKIVTHWKSF